MKQSNRLVPSLANCLGLGFASVSSSTADHSNQQPVGEQDPARKDEIIESESGSHESRKRDDKRAQKEAILPEYR